jgi:hypothetical protein
LILSDLSQGCSNKSDTIMINKNVTRLTTQGCNNTACYIMTVSDLLEQTNLLTTCDKQCEDNLLTNLLQDVRFLRVYPAGQQLKNCCPTRPATYINKQNGGTTSIIKNYDFPSLCYNKECKREEKYTTGNRICC